MWKDPATVGGCNAQVGGCNDNGFEPSLKRGKLLDSDAIKRTFQPGSVIIISAVCLRCAWDVFP